MYGELAPKMFDCDCSKNYCLGCIISWMIETAKNQMLLPTINVRCPNQKCPKTTSFNDLMEKILAIEDERNYQFEGLAKISLKHYLINNEEMRQCPAPDCEYSGFITSGYCSDKVQCKKCGLTWRDPENYSLSEKARQVIRDLLSFNSSHTTYLRSLILEEPCPKCGVMIYKNGGCPHMVCGRCKYEFCWNCLGPYFHYKHQLQLFCPFRFIAVQGVFVFLIYMLSAKIAYMDSFLIWLYWRIHYKVACSALVDVQEYYFNEFTETMIVCLAYQFFIYGSAFLIYLAVKLMLNAWENYKLNRVKKIDNIRAENTLVKRKAD
ncbi:ring finger protein [Stylonychia lemnae]|uniref:RBR-type E3 ubiquitin transferase n=1 Tax=Stylonychia lemnae TaxID=5949 RepID=A0A077ZXX8_STYLE|nr:ring finger protein [Stylonychia lemnae]|eukprot:CDW74761.1 ring finger protein [Stylonychia lemnae]